MSADLPPPFVSFGPVQSLIYLRAGDYFTADQMRAHAAAAQAAERERCAKLSAWLQWCLGNCDDCPEWNFGTTATGHIRSLLAGGDAPMPPGPCSETG